MEHFAIQHKGVRELLWLNIHCPTLLRHLRLLKGNEREHLRLVTRLHIWGRSSESFAQE